MSKKPYLTSNDLIAAVKRKISMPLTQVTFTDDEILEFANEELFLSQIPSIMQFHEEYLVYSKQVALKESVNRYDIPARAIGMKLRDLFYQDTTGDLHEMANIGLGNADLYTRNGGGSTPRNFYLESDEVVILPKNSGSVTGSLLMKYYLRPNSLVLNDRAAISNSFVKTMTITNALMANGDILRIGDNSLVAGTDFSIGASEIATATNIANAISLLEDYTATAAGDGTLSLFFEGINTVISTTSAGLAISSKTGIRCNAIPLHFVSGMLVDFLQTAGGHRTYDFDVEVPEGGVTSDTVYFNHSDIPEKFVIGDYICEQNECIIPQIPSDLHTLLSERTCSRVLEALGDKEGVASSNSKISDLEQRQAVLLDNRVEGAPRKLVNRNSFLRRGKRRRSF